ncbi:transposase [Pandoraea sputorum]|uniref:Transposase n=1 Tax=Pandoraea sputorum TaxID=93222 RepID=A0A5E5BFF2_9BURK|nr:transposase [Pandoraea sputorum]
MRQKRGDVVGAVGRQATEHVFQIDIGILAVELRRSNQAHDRGGPLPGAQRPGEQPVRPSSCPQTNLIFQPIIVDGHVPIGQITRERVPALEAVVERLGDRRSLADPFALGKQPLPREVVRHELPEAERFCANDGHVLVEFGVEVSEQLDVIPAQLRVIQHQRVKYACPCCDLGIRVTPAPPRIIARELLTESALAWIATSKYQFGMLLFRQASRLSRFGGDISSNTLAASMVRVDLATQPVIHLMRDALLEAGFVYCDETTFQVLKEENRRAQSKRYL